MKPNLWYVEVYLTDDRYRNGNFYKWWSVSSADAALRLAESTGRQGFWEGNDFIPPSRIAKVRVTVDKPESCSPYGNEVGDDTYGVLT